MTEAGHPAAGAAVHDVDAQQEANRKLGFSPIRTMQIAQRLFQGVEIGGGEMEGLITYHRTDSTTLSEKALTRIGARRSRRCSATSTTAARGSTRPR